MTLSRKNHVSEEALALALSEIRFLRRMTELGVSRRRVDGVDYDRGDDSGGGARGRVLDTDAQHLAARSQG